MSCIAGGFFYQMSHREAPSAQSKSMEKVWLRRLPSGAPRATPLSAWLLLGGGSGAQAEPCSPGHISILIF